MPICANSRFRGAAPRVLAARSGNLFFTTIAEALSEVEADYEVVVIGCPPQLGFLTMSGRSAATAVLVTVNPQMLEVMSMCKFLLMTANLLGVVADTGGDAVLQHDHIHGAVDAGHPSVFRPV